MTNAMLATAQEDKRSTRRKPFFRTVRIVLASGAKLCVPPFDISDEGIGLILDNELKRGTSVKLSFLLPLGPENLVDVEVTGVCTHSHLSGKAGGFKTGMQFQNAPSRVSEALKEFMAL